MRKAKLAVMVCALLSVTGCSALAGERAKRLTREIDELLEEHDERRADIARMREKLGKLLEQAKK